MAGLDKVIRTMPQAATQQEILIVDDNVDDVALVRRILKRGGYSVSDCNFGKLALRAVQEKAPDLMILDLSLPDMDGFEILRAVRHQMPRLKVLVLSGFMDGQLLDAARALGAMEVLDKLAMSNKLLIAVDKLLENAS
jgi:CheY-like chemotaxis protein